MHMAISAICIISSCTKPLSVYDCKCNYLGGDPVIDTTFPSFNWKIQSIYQMRQDSYQIQVASSRSSLLDNESDIWDSGRVFSPDQVMVPYQGPALKSRQQCWWRVRVWASDTEVSSWSEPQHFSIGIVGGDTLKGEYIGAFPGQGRSSLLKKDFNLESAPGQAVLHVNSLGYHEVYINGEKVSDAVLTPAVSELRKRSLIVTYDVTDKLHKGDNEIVLWTGSGWYKPKTFEAQYEGALVKAELDLVNDGTAECILATDASWQGRWSGYCDLGSWLPGQFEGESIDAGQVPCSFNPEELSKLEWSPVDVVDVKGIIATPQTCELCTVQETISPVSVEAYGDTAWVVDFGKILNGFLDISLPGLPDGHVTSARFSDYMDKDGVLQFCGKSQFISSGKEDGDHFVNRFNHHVFRYVLLEGLQSKPSIADLKGMRIRTDYTEASSFECSDPDMNAIHDMVHYTVENLAFDGYMVDCANRERLGYGGDGNASALTLQIMYDANPLFTNWMLAWNDSVKDDGGLPHTAPNPYMAGGGPYWCGFIVQAPWRYYISYGDKRLIENSYATMKRWLGYVDKYTVDGLLRDWPYEWYRQWFLGDWAGPKGLNVSDPESIQLVNNCSLCQVYADLIQIAGLLHLDQDKADYERRLSALSQTINSKLYHPETCTYASGSQIDMVYPMLVGIVPDDVKPSLLETLKKRTADVYGGNLSTGLVGVPVITEWATLEREVEFMYGMLKERDYPGYLYMIDNGATGTWEYWDARNSRLHNCYNGIGSWFYQALGGIIPEAPGYRKVRIDPQLPSGMDWVRVSKETPYGTIKVYSKKEQEGLSITLDLPVGVTAVIGGREYSGSMIGETIIL